MKVSKRIQRTLGEDVFGDMERVVDGDFGGRLRLGRPRPFGGPVLRWGIDVLRMVRHSAKNQRRPTARHDGLTQTPWRPPRSPSIHTTYSRLWTSDEGETQDETIRKDHKGLVSPRDLLDPRQIRDSTFSGEIFSFQFLRLLNFDLQTMFDDISKR